MVLDVKGRKKGKFHFGHAELDTHAEHLRGCVELDFRCKIREYRFVNHQYKVRLSSFREYCRVRRE